MKTKLITSLLGIVIAIGSSSSFAASLSDLSFNMGTNYGNVISIKYQEANGAWMTTDDAGGNFGSVAGRDGINNGATLDGLKLSFAYCIDLFHPVSLNGNYTADVSFTGTFADRGAIRNAGQIAWLLNNQASTATDLDKQAALQAVIWKQVYGNQFELLSTGTIKTAYDNYIALLGNNVAPVNSVVWIDPYSGNNRAVNNQDIVAMMVTPIPASIWLFGSAIVGLIGLGKRQIIL
jgi:hypothetical protein